MCREPLVDALVPMHQLRAVLEALRQRGQTQITFEGLRCSCRVALETDDGKTGAMPIARWAVPELASAAAAVATARIVYHYIKLGHVWGVTHDRRDRLYHVCSVLETLDWIQSQGMRAENEGVEPSSVVIYLSWIQSQGMPAENEGAAVGPASRHVDRR